MHTQKTHTQTYRTEIYRTKNGYVRSSKNRTTFRFDHNYINVNKWWARPKLTKLTSLPSSLCCCAVVEATVSWTAAARNLKALVVLGPSDPLEFVSLFCRFGGDCWTRLIEENCAANCFLRSSLYRAIRSARVSDPSDIFSSESCPHIFNLIEEDVVDTSSFIKHPEK